MAIDTDKAKNFFDAYLQYRQSTEAPYQYHRWSMVTCLGALLRRNFWIEHGPFTVYPNLYIMLIGEAGARKSTAIKQAVELIRDYGYTDIAADKTSKEAFLFDLSCDNVNGYHDEDLINAGGKETPFKKGTTKEDILDANIIPVDSEPRCCLVAADEFNDFVGSSNMEFLTTLGNLWDYKGVFKHRLKNSKEVTIPDPTITILSGNTQENFQIAFPPEAAGQGILSRLILIHGEATGKRISFPEKPTNEDKAILLSILDSIMQECHGPATIEPDALERLDYIYQNWKPIKDHRLVSYGQRRFTQLLKLCLINAAARVSRVITVEDVMLSNSLLTHAEIHMPKALGEYGKSKSWDVAGRIIKALEEAVDRGEPGLDNKALLKIARTDVANVTDFHKIITMLQAAGRIKTIELHGKSMMIPIKEEVQFKVDKMYDLHLLWELGL